MKNVIFWVFFLAFGSFANAQGHRIEVELRDTSLSEIFLGYHYGKAQYITDTAYVDANGKYIFEGEENLESGVYLIVFPPDNLFLELLVDSLEQNVRLSTNFHELTKELTIHTEGQNKAFYDYVDLVDQSRDQVAQLNTLIDSGDINEAEYTKRKSFIDSTIAATQEHLIDSYDGRMIDIVLSSARQIKMPSFDTLSGDALNMAKFRYYREHYFDHIDLADNRLLRTPFLFGKIDDYVKKMTYQHPDSIFAAIDYVLTSMDPKSDMFKYYLIKFVNGYASSKFVGLDAVFVDIVDKYYRTGMAYWTDEESLAKVIKQADRTKPLLLGKLAPNINLTLRDGTEIDIHSIEAEYTILFFWDPKCGVCKKSMPVMKDFYEKYKDQGVAILGVCNKRGEEVKQCWELADEKGISDWMLAFDPTGYYKIKYDVNSTPMIYVLDDEKTIMSKKIGAGQLDDLIARLIEEKKMSTSEMK